MQNLLVALLAISPLAAVAFAPAPQAFRATSAIKVSRVYVDGWMDGSIHRELVVGIEMNQF
jgi:hypothetical protein